MKKSHKRDGWFSVRGYPHLDRPLSFERAQALVTDPHRVARHGFLPLLSYTDTKRQFRTDNSNPLIPRRLRPKIVKNKSRDIKYAAHADSAIYAYYAMLLQEKYEHWLHSHSLQQSVIGYRSGIGSNVDMAAEAFAEVVARGNVTALCFDISDFFPSISHAELKAGICAMLETATLPDDWYKVFRACTKFSHIDFVELSKLFNFKPEQAPRPLVSDLPSAMDTIRGSRRLEINRRDVEVPQGTPISAVFANVSMFNFDLEMLKWAVQHGAEYRRYSDDILLLVDPSHEIAAATFVPALAASIGRGLQINAGKTEISRFSVTPHGQLVDRPITYLGFTFDGQKVTLRARTLSRYYRRVSYAARGTIRGAGRAGQPASEAFRRSIYKDLTHLGSANFYQYAKRAHAKFHASGVKRQLRRHFRIVMRKLENRGR